MAGFASDMASLNNRMGGIILSIRDGLEAAVRFDRFLDGLTDAELQARGFSAGEITTVRAAFNALVVARNVVNGQATAPAADNMLFHAEKLTSGL